MYRGFVFYSGTRDPSFSWELDDLATIIAAVNVAAPVVVENFPDVTEISVEDDGGVQWYRIRLRKDDPTPTSRRTLVDELGELDEL